MSEAVARVARLDLLERAPHGISRRGHDLLILELPFLHHPVLLAQTGISQDPSPAHMGYDTSMITRLLKDTLNCWKRV